MDRLLTQRYNLLFDAYEIEDLGTLSLMKSRLRRMINEGFLRPDAALYLLSNFDAMIAQPYYGRIYEVTNTGISEIPSIFSRDRAPKDLDTALNIIIESTIGERPHSSHAISLAVERSWTPLSNMFGWA